MNLKTTATILLCLGPHTILMIMYLSFLHGLLSPLLEFPSSLLIGQICVTFDWSTGTGFDIATAVWVVSSKRPFDLQGVLQDLMQLYVIVFVFFFFGLCCTIFCPSCCLFLKLFVILSPSHFPF